MVPFCWKLSHLGTFSEAQPWHGRSRTQLINKTRLDRVFTARMPRDYDDFDLEIGKEGDAYVARVRFIGMGDAENPFSSPFRDQELDQLLARIGVARRDVTPAVDERRPIQEIGQRLYSAVFAGTVGSFWECLPAASARIWPGTSASSSPP